MTTKEIVEKYLEEVAARGAWETLVADDAEFERLTTPSRRVQGRAAFLEATRRFYSSIGSLDVLELIVDGERACALTRYEVRPPQGAPPFESYVAEFFVVKSDRIAKLAICFDLTPYPKA